MLSGHKPSMSLFKFLIFQENSTMSLEGKSSKNSLFTVRLTVRVDLVRVPNPLALALHFHKQVRRGTCLGFNKVGRFITFVRNVSNWRRDQFPLNGLS